MAVNEFNISITPKEAYHILNNEVKAELIFKEIKSTDEGKEYAVLVFEKYYFRAENRAALTIIIDNMDGVSSVKAIAAGSSKGLFLNFDWGAAYSFAESVKEILNKYII